MTDVKTMTNDEIKAHTLSWVNAFRTEHGLQAIDELPKGLMGHHACCTLGMATGLRFSLRGYAIPGVGVQPRVPLPAVVAECERRFEEGEMPELLAHPRPWPTVGEDPDEEVAALGARMHHRVIDVRWRMARA